jgi:hypothetical protein
VFSDSGDAHGPAIVVVLLMAVQAGLGLLFPGEYRDEPWIVATWWGNDWVTLVVAVPLLAGALAVERLGSIRARLLVLGLLTYAVYNYAFYLFGATLNTFFLLYVVLIVASVATLVLKLAALDVPHVARAFAETTPVRIVGGYLVITSVGLGIVWTALWAAFAFAGRATPVESEVFKLVAALDLSIMVPLLATGGVLLWRRRPWGYVIAAMAGAQASVYLLVLAINASIAIHRGLVAAPGEAPLWGVLFVFTTAATVWLLASVSPAAATTPIEE